MTRPRSRRQLRVPPGAEPSAHYKSSTRRDVPVKIFKQGLCLALLGAGFAALPGLQAGAVGQPAPALDRSLVQQMRSEADGDVRVARESATGKVGFIRATGNGDLLPDVAGDTTAKAVEKASAYLDRFGAAFGATKAQLVQDSVEQNALRPDDHLHPAVPGCRRLRLHDPRQPGQVRGAHCRQRLRRPRTRPLGRPEDLGRHRRRARGEHRQGRPGAARRRQRRRHLRPEGRGHRARRSTGWEP